MTVNRETKISCTSLSCLNQQVFPLIQYDQLDTFWMPLSRKRFSGFLHAFLYTDMRKTNFITMGLSLLYMLPRRFVRLFTVYKYLFIPKLKFLNLADNQMFRYIKYPLVSCLLPCQTAQTRLKRET